MLPETFRCLLVTQDASGRCEQTVARRPTAELPSGDVVVRVVYSSLNYKDALAATGHPGVNKVFPLVPGVDAAGVVAESGVYEFVAGDPVLVTGFEMGSNRWGGYAELVRVPQAWLVPMPAELSAWESMALGTGGLTAALCVEALIRHNVTPDSGDVVVTGASGGVGSMAVAILAGLGYHVVAVTGKPGAREFLENLGTAEVVGRDAVDDTSGRPLLSGRWAGAVDTVGGNTLSTLLRATRLGGCVAACGLARSAELPITVYPFILRGVTLAGIDAAWTPAPLRHLMWERLAGLWRPAKLAEMARTVPLEKLPAEFPAILAGQITGRVVVEI